MKSEVGSCDGVGFEGPADGLAGWLPSGELENLQKIIFGALIIVFLIKEPDGLARLWRQFAARVRVWPLRY